MVSPITGILNHHAVDNGNVELYPPDYPLGYLSDSVPDIDNTPIMFISDDELGKIYPIFSINALVISHLKDCSV